MFSHLRGGPSLRAPGESSASLRYLEAVADPRAALRRMATGEMRAEDVEALSTLYPREFARLRTDVLAQLASADAPPSYPSRVALSILLGAAVDPSMAPENVARLQAMSQRSSAAAQAQETARRRAPSKLASNMETRTDQLLSKR
jgi:hypothetical protein